MVTQIKNVSNFIYIYGKVVNGLEVADEQAKSTWRRLKPGKDQKRAKTS